MEQTLNKHTVTPKYTWNKHIGKGRHGRNKHTGIKWHQMSTQVKRSHRRKITQRNTETTKQVRKHRHSRNKHTEKTQVHCVTAEHIRNIDLVEANAGYNRQSAECRTNTHAGKHRVWVGIDSRHHRAVTSTQRNVKLQLEQAHSKKLEQIRRK